MPFRPGMAEKGNSKIETFEAHRTRDIGCTGDGKPRGSLMQPHLYPADGILLQVQDGGNLVGSVGILRGNSKEDESTRFFAGMITALGLWSILGVGAL